MYKVLLCCVALLCQGVWAQEQRIVALAPHIVENLYAIGVGDSIVATVDHADYPKAAEDIPRVGGFYGVQLEKILALKPTLVIAWQGGNKAQDIAALKKLDLKVHVSQVKTVQDISNEIRTLGELTQHQAQSEQVASKLEQQYQQLLKQYENKHAQPVKVFYQLWHSPLMSVNSNTLIGHAIEVCGAQNVFADSQSDYPQLSVENVIASAPDIIVMTDEQDSAEQPIQWHKWAMIPAVKNQAIVSVNADLLHRYSVRLLKGMRQLCEVIEQQREFINR